MRRQCLRVFVFMVFSSLTDNLAESSGNVYYSGQSAVTAHSISTSFVSPSSPIIHRNLLKADNSISITTVESRIATKVKSDALCDLKQGKFRGEFLTSDDFMVEFEVGSNLRRNVTCTLIRDNITVVFAMGRCKSPLNMTNRLRRDGQYRLTIESVQKTKRRRAKAKSFWILDRKPPKTEFLMSSHRTSKFVVIYFGGRDRWNVSFFECRVNQGSWHRCSSPYKARPVRPERHIPTDMNYSTAVQRRPGGRLRFGVRAVDNAGNVDPTPVVLIWRKTTTGPIPRPPTAPVADTNIEATELAENSDSDSNKRDLATVLGILGAATFLFFVCLIAGILRHNLKNSRNQKKAQFVAYPEKCDDTNLEPKTDASPRD